MPRLLLPARFETPRLQLAIANSADAAELLAAISESLPALRQFPASLPWALEPPSLASSLAFCSHATTSYTENRDFNYLFRRRDGGELLGCIGLHRFNPRVPKAEIGFWCRSRMTQQGYTREALQGLVSLAHSQLQVERLEILTDDRNIPTHRLCEGSGFQLEGILRRERRAPDGELCDMRLYALLPASI